MLLIRNIPGGYRENQRAAGDLPERHFKGAGANQQAEAENKSFGGSGEAQDELPGPTHCQLVAKNIKLCNRLKYQFSA